MIRSELGILVAATPCSALTLAACRATTPHGNTDSFVYNVLSGRTELPMPDCYQGKSALGSGGYVQIIDFFLGGSRATPPDITKDYSTVGYAVQVTATNLDVAKGFC